MTNASARKVLSMRTRTTTKTIVSISSRNVSLVSGSFLPAIGGAGAAVFGAGGAPSGIGGEFIGAVEGAPAATAVPDGVDDAPGAMASLFATPGCCASPGNPLGSGGLSSGMKHLLSKRTNDATARTNFN